MDIAKLKEAITKAKNTTSTWHTNGWDITFGSRGTVVRNLEEAKKLPLTFNFRLEAIAYWERVKGSSQEALVWADKALAALDRGDIRDAGDSVYYAMVIEKPIVGSAPTWTEPAGLFLTRVSQPIT